MATFAAVTQSVTGLVATLLEAAAEGVTVASDSLVESFNEFADEVREETRQSRVDRETTGSVDPWDDAPF